MDDDREALARAIADGAEHARRRQPRWLWGLALAVGVTCVVALAIAWIQDHDTPAERPVPAQAADRASGFGSGLVLGIAAGIAIGAALALRRR
jgi:hypothetical protein